MHKLMVAILSLVFFNNCGRRQLTEFATLQITTPQTQFLTTGLNANSLTPEPSSISEINCIGALVGFPGGSFGPGLSQNKGFCSEISSANGEVPFPVATYGGLIPINAQPGSTVNITVPNVALNVPLSIHLIGFKSNGSTCQPVSPRFEPEQLGYSEAYVLGKVALNGANTSTAINMLASFDPTKTLGNCDGPIFNSGSGTFDPASQGPLAYWIDAADPDSFTMNGSNEITNITNKGIHNLSFITSPPSPIIAVNWPGTTLNSFLFNGDSDFLMTTSSSQNNATYFFVYQATNLGTDRHLYSAIESGNDRFFKLDSEENLYAEWGPLIVSNVVTSPLNKNIAVLKADYDGIYTTLELSHGIFSPDSGTQPSIVTTNCPTAIGALVTYGTSCSVTSYGNKFQGHLAEVLIYDATLAQTEISEVIQYLQQKWQVP